MCVCEYIYICMYMYICIVYIYMYVYMSHVQPFATPWTVAHQAAYIDHSLLRRLSLVCMKCPNQGHILLEEAISTQIWMFQCPYNWPNFDAVPLHMLLHLQNKKKAKWIQEKNVYCLLLLLFSRFILKFMLYNIIYKFSKKIIFIKLILKISC